VHQRTVPSSASTVSCRVPRPAKLLQRSTREWCALSCQHSTTQGAMSAGKRVSAPAAMLRHYICQQPCSPTVCEQTAAAPTAWPPWSHQRAAVLTDGVSQDVVARGVGVAEAAAEPAAALRGVLHHQQLHASWLQVNHGHATQRIVPAAGADAVCVSVQWQRVRAARQAVCSLHMVAC
jgi:hypothetical protein